MPRAVWSGRLSFGLVGIAVRLFPATEPKDVRFHLMDQRGRRVRYRRFVDRESPTDVEASDVRTAPPAAAPGEDEPLGAGEPEPRGDRRDEPGARPAPGGPDETEVAYADLMRGFEADDGSVVLLSHEEIEGVRPERSRAIEIEDFVELADIDPVFYEKSYVVAPQNGAEKPYALLLRAIEASGRVGIGRFVLRTKPHLVAIRPREGALALETLFFGDEVRDARSLVSGVEDVAASERELALAQTLIDTLKTDWNPDAYADEYRAELLRMIAAKTPIDRPEAEDEADGPPSRRAEELMEALRASVEAARKDRKRSTRKRPA